MIYIVTSAPWGFPREIEAHAFASPAGAFKFVREQIMAEIGRCEVEDDLAAALQGNDLVALLDVWDEWLEADPGDNCPYFTLTQKEVQP